MANLQVRNISDDLAKTDGRLVKHARYYWLLLAESHLTRRLFGAMGGAERWAAASVGIAQAMAAPKETIPISPRNGGAVSAPRPVKSGQSSPGHRRTLAGRTAAVCLAAACVLLMLPAVTLAQTPVVPAVPQGLKATSGGDGTMTLKWNTATDADDGYDYRLHN